MNLKIFLLFMLCIVYVLPLNARNQKYYYIVGRGENIEVILYSIYFDSTKGRKSPFQKVMSLNPWLKERKDLHLNFREKLLLPDISKVPFCNITVSKKGRVTVKHHVSRRRTVKKLRQKGLLGCQEKVGDKPTKKNASENEKNQPPLKLKKNAVPNIEEKKSALAQKFRFSARSMYSQSFLTSKDLFTNAIARVRTKHNLGLELEFQHMLNDWLSWGFQTYYHRLRYIGPADRPILANVKYRYEGSSFFHIQLTDSFKLGPLVTYKNFHFLVASLEESLRILKMKASGVGLSLEFSQWWGISKWTLSSEFKIFERARSSVLKLSSAFEAYGKLSATWKVKEMMELGAWIAYRFDHLKTQVTNQKTDEGALGFEVGF